MAKMPTLPKPYAFVAAARGEKLIGRRKGDPLHLAFVALQFVRLGVVAAENFIYKMASFLSYLERFDDFFKF